MIDLKLGDSDLSGAKRALATTKLVWNIGFTLLSRGMNLMLAFLTVPLAVSGLGSVDYGIFAVILSAATFAAYSDFGLALAVVNPLAKAEEESDHVESQRIISQIWNILLAISALIFLGSVIGAVIVSIGDGESSSYAWPICFACVAINIPSALSQRILFALQKGYQSNIWVSVGKIVALIGVYICNRAHLTLSFYVLSMLGLPSIVGWINTIWLFKFCRPDLTPKTGGLRASSPLLFRQGFSYTILQMGPYLESGFDVLLVGTLIGAEVAASYDLIYRAYNYIPALAAIGIMPLWPAITSAQARGDLAWISRIKALASCLTIAVAGAASIGLYMYHAPIIFAWTGHHVSFPLVAVASISVSTVLMSYSGLLNTFILSKSDPHKLAAQQAIFVVFLLSLKVLLLKVIGISGPLLATAVLYIPRLFWLRTVSR